MEAIKKIDAKISKLKKIKKLFIKQEESDKMWSNMRHSPLSYNETEVLGPFDILYINKNKLGIQHKN